MNFDIDLKELICAVEQALSTATMTVRFDKRDDKEIADEYGTSIQLVRAVKAGQDLWDFNDAIKILGRSKDEPV
jgi:hypothetical protein